MTETPTTATEPGNEVAVNGNDEGTLEVFPPARTPNMAALGTLGEHVDAMRKAVYFAEGMCYTQMVPQRFQGKPKDAAAAVLFGAEVGLSPIAALRSVIVIHGQPGFEARTMKAILKAHGYKFRTIEKTNERAEMWCWEPDSPKVYDDDGNRINPDETAAWTIADAVQAGFVPTLLPGGKYELNSNGKLKGNMKYLETPRVMLEAKVTAEVCRAIAPHILLGLPYSAEEIETEISDDNDRAEVSNPVPQRGKGVAALRDRAKKAKAAAAEVVDAEEVADPAGAAPEPGPTTAADATPDVAPEPPKAQEPAPEPQPVAVAPQPAEPAATAGPVITEVTGTTGEDLPGTPPQERDGSAAPVADPEPTATAGPADATGDTTGAADPSAEPDMEMSPAVRSKGVDMLSGLLINGGLATDEYRGDALSEVAAKRPGATYRRIDSIDQLTNTELKFMVDTFRAWKAQGVLESWLGEAINNAGVRESGMLPDEAQA